MNASSFPLRAVTANLVELLGSMRFAVSLLVFICLASVIGTIVPQNQPPVVYVDLFGPFWVAVFERFAIARVYNSAWFLGVMAFLVISTTLCLVRNTPKMLRAARAFREHVRGDSLRNIAHHVEVTLPMSPETACQRAQALLARQGYAMRVRVDGNKSGANRAQGVSGAQDQVEIPDRPRLLAAKKGSSNRLGYVFAHTAIVVICVGGLLDSELPVRLQVWFADKQPITENMLVAQVPPSGRLPPGNPGFRASLLIPEGNQSSSAIVAVDDGVLVQPLPFVVRLKQFLVEYYSTGMPSSFKSEVEIIDPDTGETFARTIEVNEPLRYKGITVYQSSFDDGGSRLQLSAYPLRGAQAQVVALEGEVGRSVELGAALGIPAGTVQFSRLRPINVENLAAREPPQPKPWIDHVASVTGSAVLASHDNLVNVGPSLEYRVTGNDGQSREFVNYMRPMLLDGDLVFLAGVRDTPAQAYRYLRIPADAQQSVAQFMALRAALHDPILAGQAARRFAQDNANERLSSDLLQRAASGALESFANGGLEALIAHAPQDQHEKILGFAVPMIQVSLAHLLDALRERQAIAPVDPDSPEAAATQRWLQLALLALANLPAYDAPVFLQLDTFEHVQASVFQVTRTPGKFVVYLGCLFLVLGVFAMFYIHDRRVWVWIRPDPEHPGHSRALAAMSSQRRTLDFEQAFARFRDDFQRLSHDLSASGSSVSRDPSALSDSSGSPSAKPSSEQE